MPRTTPSRPARATRVAALALVTLAAGVGGVGVARAEGSSKTRNVRVEATAVSPAGTNGQPACDPGGRCLVATGITATYSGGITGTSTANGVIHVDPTTFAYQGTSMELLTVSVGGCGTGSFVVHYPLFTGAPAPTRIRGVIVAGTGTGELAGISGTIDGTYTPGPAGSSSSITLRAKCRPA